MRRSIDKTDALRSPQSLVRDRVRVMASAESAEKLHHLTGRDPLALLVIEGLPLPAYYG
jgi:hypothetical protein